MIKLYSFKWVPPVVRGHVRDMRVRWALEEAGLEYENVRIGFNEITDTYRATLQPFGQVPAYEEDGLRLFESGAIVHHLALQSEALMPRAPKEQALVTEWMFAAMSSIEPFIAMCAPLSGIGRREPRIDQLVGKRLDDLIRALDGREFVCERFTAADILLAHVLHILKNEEDLLAARPALLEYRDRCFARPAFKKALADHMASFDESAGPR